MNRHHLLGLLDSLQEKYKLQDGEYKEFAEAIGGKKKELDITNAKMVKVTYDEYESVVEWGDEEMFPNMFFQKDCSRIWKIIPDENRYHLCSVGLSFLLLNRSNIHTTEIQKFIDDYTKDTPTKFSCDKKQRKRMFRVKDIEILDT